MGKGTVGAPRAACNAYFASEQDPATIDVDPMVFRVQGAEVLFDLIGCLAFREIKDARNTIYMGVNGDSFCNVERLG